ncbi:MAG: hypothetical protein Q9166_004127 [cf. Caloplaca sp. 2 TL-2023]
MDHSGSMAPADIDAMLQHVSNQMARSQLFRRLSANSNNSSPSRRGNTRIAKAHSNNVTPHGVQRARTTAAHPSRTRPPAIQPSEPSQVMPQIAAAMPQRTRLGGTSSTARPMTWHPGSYPLDNCPEAVPHGGGFDFQTPLIDQDPGFADSLDDALPYSFEPVPTSYAHYQDLRLSNCSQTALPADTMYSSSCYDYSLDFPQQCNRTHHGLDSSSADIHTADLPQIPSDHAIYSTQQTPDSLYLQPQSYPRQYVQSPLPPQITKQRSKELVGMGLYDGPSRRELSALNASPTHIGQLLAEPQGKGLKLEETWQPPNDDVDDVGEEGYSTDEAEEDLPAAPAPRETQSTFVPAYGDLSNQSFFFDSDDPFTNYMSFDAGVQAYQPKMCDAANQNFMWL